MLTTQENPTSSMQAYSVYTRTQPIERGIGYMRVYHATHRFDGGSNFFYCAQVKADLLFTCQTQSVT